MAKKQKSSFSSASKSSRTSEESTISSIQQYGLKPKNRYKKQPTDFHCYYDISFFNSNVVSNK